MSKIKGFVFYFLARSGSTFVIMKLKNHPQVQARAEVFGAKTLPGDLEQTDDNQIRFVRKLWREYKHGSHAEPTLSRGFKIQVSDPPQLLNLKRYARVVGDYDLCHFFLYRRNKVKQLISSMRAKQVQQFTEKVNGLAQAHMYKENEALRQCEFEKLYVEPVSFKKRLISIGKHELQLDNYKKYIGSTRDLYYEDMMNDKAAFFCQICEDIGIDPNLLANDDEVLKITNDDLTKVIENFDELHNELKGTEFEAQLLDGHI